MSRQWHKKIVEAFNILRESPEMNDPTDFGYFEKYLTSKFT
jgi:hypothetical protein